MSSNSKFNRGDIVLLPIAFVSGVGTKVRPAIIVQNDNLNSKLKSTIVAIITSTNIRSGTEPTQLLIDIRQTVSDPDCFIIRQSKLNIWIPLIYAILFENWSFVRADVIGT